MDYKLLPDELNEEQKQNTCGNKIKKFFKFVATDVLAIDPQTKWYNTAFQIGFSLWAAKESYDLVNDFSFGNAPGWVIQVLANITGVIVFVGTQQITTTQTLSLVQNKLDTEISRLNRELAEFKEQIARDNRVINSV